jgi:hypothetical protein
MRCSRPMTLERHVSRGMMPKCYRVFVAILLVCTTAVLPRMARNASAQSVTRDTVTYDDEMFAAIAQARGIPDLRTMSLPDGYREIRIRGDLSMGLKPTPMLRLAEEPDGTRRGELVLFRRLFLRPGNPAPRADERCAPLRDQHLCVRTWRPQSDDWVGIASVLELLGAWSISERCEVSNDSEGRFVRSWVGDSGGLNVQRLIGSTFSQYGCNAPRFRTTTSAGQRAHEIDEYCLSVVEDIPYEFDTIAK